MFAFGVDWVFGGANRCRAGAGFAVGGGCASCVPGYPSSKISRVSRFGLEVGNKMRKTVANLTEALVGFGWRKGVAEAAYRWRQR